MNFMIKRTELPRDIFRRHTCIVEARRTLRVSNSRPLTKYLIGSISSELFRSNRKNGFDRQEVHRHWGERGSTPTERRRYSRIQRDGRRQRMASLVALHNRSV